MEILFEEANERSVALDGGKEIGECTFISSGDKCTINHTFVEPTYEGRGIARQLVEKIIDVARERNQKVAATCPYVVALFQKTDKYDDVAVK
ncbi:N-acetyltransferase [Streptococcus sp. X16XC17]|uniref:GNAT family N-acetyltransferase n=1 Tax=unclassified Streptococcus TaxID=2608887 RepID=UPI00066FCBA5|nr:MULTISPECIES: GNAT family N-acetyltransferase [unclassified Streptococcus]TCD46302.1 N-acetyltransferase [Streptococcus sp. X16XC17]